MRRYTLGAATAAVAFGLLAVPAAAHADTVQSIVQRGKVDCPVPVGGFVGSAELDNKGNWQGLDVDICRAIATAILGAPSKANFVPVSWAQRFPSIQSGDLDFIAMATGWTLSRNTEIGLDFTQPYFFTGMQLLVRASSGVKSPPDLSGAAICVTGGTTMERDLSDYMRGAAISYRSVTFDSTDESSSAFFAGRCDAIVDTGQSLAILASSQPEPSQYKIIPDRPLTLEPESIAVRGGDHKMLAIANWVLTALVEADELGITSANVEDAVKSRKSDPAVAALLGLTPGIGKDLGLRKTWVQDVIKGVGNYRQIYDRSMGKDSPYKIPPGYNTLYSEGGLLYPLTID